MQFNILYDTMRRHKINTSTKKGIEKSVRTHAIDRFVTSPFKRANSLNTQRQMFTNIFREILHQKAPNCVLQLEL